MGFLSHHHPLSRHQRGFSLTELAIVLGVAGTFLAGTWAAYGKVMKKVKINRSVAQIELLVANLKKAFPHGRVNPYGTDITGELIDAGIIPPDMLLDCTGGFWGVTNSGTNGLCAGLPQLGNVQIHMDPGSGYSSAPFGINLVPIWIGGITNNDCPAFMAEILKRIAPPTLVWIQSIHSDPTAANGMSTGSGANITQTTTPDVFRDCGTHTGIVIRL